MSHVVPFTISGFTFTHVEPGDARELETRRRYAELHDIATDSWRHEAYQPCAIQTEGETVFAIIDDQDRLAGAVALYRQRIVNPAYPNVITALFAPLFDEVEVEIPTPSTGPNGMVVNGTEIDAASQREARFWRKTMAVMEHIFIHGLELEEGGTITIDHFRFPQVEDGDPAQHEWTGMREKFDRYSKLIVYFDDTGDRPLRMTSFWKTTDPDPDRERGEFDA